MVPKVSRRGATAAVQIGKLDEAEVLISRGEAAIAASAAAEVAGAAPATEGGGGGGGGKGGGGGEGAELAKLRGKIAEQREAARIKQLEKDAIAYQAKASPSSLTSTST